MSFRAKLATVIALDLLLVAALPILLWVDHAPWRERVIVVAVCLAAWAILSVFSYARLRRASGNPVSFDRYLDV